MADTLKNEEGMQVGVIGPQSEYTRMSDAAITELAQDIRAGRVFGTWQIPDGDTVITPELCFSFLMLFDMFQRKRIQRDGTVHVWENLDKAEQMQVNGYPIFYSGRMIDQTDFNRLMTATKREEPNAYPDC